MNEIQADEAGYERGWEQAEDYWRAKEQARIVNLLLEFDAQDDDRMLVLDLVKEIQK